MNIIDERQIPHKRTDWATQLAELTRLAWTGRDGRCYFPYRPLIEANEWETKVKITWESGAMHSWVLADDQGRFIAHAALVQKPGYWELGRWVAHPNAPKGAMTRLCEEAMTYARKIGLRVQVECTQAHTSSQIICERLGLRFAGIGVLDRIEDIPWDILYFDTDSSPPFSPKAGLLANPLGRELRAEAGHQTRLREISQILTTDRGGELPPTRFHALPHLIAPIRSIIALNT